MTFKSAFNIEFHFFSFKKKAFIVTSGPSKKPINDTAKNYMLHQKYCSMGLQIIQVVLKCPLHGQKAPIHYCCHLLMLSITIDNYFPIRTNHKANDLFHLLSHTNTNTLNNNQNMYLNIFIQGFLRGFFFNFCPTRSN